ncbi:MAG: DoxX family protein [Paracoccus sp. (in: a-proteobacteria)]|uniref:DoxX family protein n=1 Tax=Paracoccus sp. TaxID=267 RepID=UPI0026E0807F|nr:DoxX family protein [Paracoccus sp. (in: a-proteobacteria)]MDO5632762.1 DoxX family protein [Paracoccus sp. (in: a-proteobacteria)]
MTNVLSSFGFGKANATAHAALILRVTLGVLFLAHAGLKIFVFTPSGTAGYFASLGLPGALAYLTIAAETLGGLALIVGFQTSLVALALIPVLLGAAVLGHGGNGFWFNNQGGGWEYPAFWAVTLLVQAMLGGGAKALTRN